MRFIMISQITLQAILIIISTNAYSEIALAEQFTLRCHFNTILNIDDGRSVEAAHNNQLNIDYVFDSGKNLILNKDGSPFSDQEITDEYIRLGGGFPVSINRYDGYGQMEFGTAYIRHGPCEKLPLQKRKF